MNQVLTKKVSSSLGAVSYMRIRFENFIIGLTDNKVRKEEDKDIIDKKERRKRRTEAGRQLLKYLSK